MQVPDLAMCFKVMRLHTPLRISQRGSELSPDRSSHLRGIVSLHSIVLQKTHMFVIVLI